MDKFEIVGNFIKALTSDEVVKNKGHNGEYFEDNKFFLNKTCLCRITGNAIFMSKSTVTPKCAVYLKLLKNYFTKLRLPIILVPQWYCSDTRTHQFSEGEIIGAFCNELNLLKDNASIYSKIHLEELLAALEQINEKCFEVPEELIEDMKSALKNICTIIDPKSNEVKKFIEETNYYEIVRVAYFSLEKDVAFRTALKRYLNPSGEFAFLHYDKKNELWYSSEAVCGEHKPTMTYEEGWTISQEYHNNTAKRGMKIGKYTVMKVTDSYIKINCNKYCKAMFEATYYFYLEDMKK